MTQDSQNIKESAKTSLETVHDYKLILQELKECYDKSFKSRRDFMAPTTEPKWSEIEKAREEQAMMEMQGINLYPTSPDYYEAHDNEFNGLSR